MVLEDGLERAEEVFARDGLRRHADRVDVHALLVDAQPVGSRGEHLPARLDRQLVRHPFGLAHRGHPRPEQLGDLGHDSAALLLLGLGFLRRGPLHVVEQLVGPAHVVVGGWVLADRVEGGLQAAAAEHREVALPAEHHGSAQPSPRRPPRCSSGPRARLPTQRKRVATKSLRDEGGVSEGA
eukprot:scaffold59778_cov60-Phaeocystis_antarctica.AAC.4